MSLFARILTCPPDRFPNPLSADADFVGRCDTHRESFGESLRRWREECGDEPGFSVDPGECEAACAAACAWVCTTLAKPEWDHLDVVGLAEVLPHAVRHASFRGLLEGHWLRVALTLQAARAQLDAGRCLA